MRIDIEKYPAVKQHLMNFNYDRLKQTGEPGARKLTNNKWFETQDSINYWEDFYRQKIIYPNMTKYLPFYYDQEGFMTNQKCFFITGTHIEFLTAFLNSSLFKYCYRESFPELQGGTRELSKIFFDKISVLQISPETNNKFKSMVNYIQHLISKNLPTLDLEKEIDNSIFSLYELSEQEKKEIGFIQIY